MAELTPEAKTFPDTVRQALLDAFAKGFSRLHPEDVTRDRAFRAMRQEPWFTAALGEWGKGLARGPS